MLLRILPNVFFVLALILSAAAVYAYFIVEDAPGAFVEEPDREFPSLAVGENEVVFRLHNPTRHAVRVIGAGFC